MEDRGGGPTSVKDSVDGQLENSDAIAEGETMGVANLFNTENGSASSTGDLSGITGDDARDISSYLSPASLETLKFINTPGPGTLAYDDLEDKTTLYEEGAHKYSEKNIKSKTTTNRASLVTYANDLVKILNGYPFYTKSSPAEITFNIYEGAKDEEENLLELEAIRLSYTATSKRLLTIRVPKDLMDEHIKLVNTIDRISQLIKNMEEINTSKLLALNSARQYIEESYFAVGTLADISYYLADKNITLGEDNKLKFSLTVAN